MMIQLKVKVVASMGSYRGEEVAGILRLRGS